VKAWALSLLAIGLLIWAVHVTPLAYKGVVDARRLDRSSSEALGVVTAVRSVGGKNRCSSEATIQYEVQGARYTVLARGCEAAADGAIRVGNQARVLYVSDAPQIAVAQTLGASTPTVGWGLLFFSWAGAFVSCCFVWREFRRHGRA
jgi:hypothetical protein